VRGTRPEALEYPGAATRLPEVWVAVRANLRAVLEQVTLADLAASKLPGNIARLAKDPDAWLPH
jgi:DNA-binding IscR family transcriptional regulator